MIVDTSAIIAILKDEPGCVEYETIMTASRAPLYMSAGTYLETAIVADAFRQNQTLVDALDNLISNFHLNIVPVTQAQARIARQAYQTYGRGSGHKAQLNFGDCFAYALAKDMGNALLFKGNDFAHTDVEAALP